MNTNRLTSLTLLDRLQDQSDQTAWSMFMEIYRPLMGRSMSNLAIDQTEADDLVQECLLRLVKALPTFVHNGRPGAFRTWLRTIATNRAIEYLKQRRRGMEALRGFGDQTEPFTDSFGEFLEREHDHYVVGRLMELIKPEFTNTTWLAFERQVIDGQSASCAAEELGRSVNAVLLCKSRVLRRLRELGQGLVEC